MFDDTLPLHPRPQIARRDWLDLCGPWGFAHDDTDIGLIEGWQGSQDVFTRTITVPYPPESPASGIGETSYHPIVWYRRTFRLVPEYEGKRIMLHLGAVDYRAQVWVNAHLVALHEGGSTPFCADITESLEPVEEQVIVVRAVDAPTDLTQMRGKQDWQLEPHDIWYERTTGIWQPVWIEAVSATHIQTVRWTPELERGVLSLAVQLNHQSPTPVRLRAQIRLHDSLLVDDTFYVPGSEIRRDIALDLGSTTMDRKDVLWAPGYPNLLEATLTLCMDDEVLDEVHSYAGLRSVGVAGGRFLLNGQPYYLRMALEQGYWPQTHLAAPSSEALRREVEIARELGFNGIRVHQKVEDPRFLYWCDRLGLLVWGEMANAYVFNRTSVERLTREWLEVIERDYSHPCIVAWVPINESWGVPNLLHDVAQQQFVQSMYHLTKSLDTTRPVIGNDGWEYLVGDIFGIHDYAFTGDAIRQRYGTSETIQETLHEVQPSGHFVLLSAMENENLPIMLTEFGGISYTPRAGSNWFGYGTVSNREELLRKYRELIDAVLECPNIAGFCYTQLTDTGQETNGLVTGDREFKLDPAVVYEINRRPSSAMPSDIINQLRKVSGTSFHGSVADPATLMEAAEGQQ